MSDRIPRCAVIATHDRPAELHRCVAALMLQGCEYFFIVDNASTPPVDYGALQEHMLDVSGGILSPVVDIRRDDEQPPNLSRLWNLGIDHYRGMFASVQRATGKTCVWDVAVVNDDATVPPGWWDRLSGAMRERGADVASHSPWDARGEWGVMLHDSSAAMSVATRLAGWAMLLRGEWSGARFDERMRWTYSDDDISYRARLAGGLVHVGGLDVPNEYADRSTTGALAEQSGKDRQTFIDIHGRQPW